MIIPVALGAGIFGLFVVSIVRGLRENANASAVLAENERRRKSGGAI